MRGCIRTTVQNLYHFRESATNKIIFSTTYLRFDEVNLKSDVKLAVIMFTVRAIFV